MLSPAHPLRRLGTRAAAGGDTPDSSPAASARGPVSRSISLNEPRGRGTGRRRVRARPMGDAPRHGEDQPVRRGLGKRRLRAAPTRLGLEQDAPRSLPTRIQRRRGENKLVSSFK